MTAAKQENKLRLWGGFSAVASIFLLLLLIKNSELAYREVRDALKTCSEMLIPSLFPLMVASEIATETGALERVGRPLLRPISRLFGISESATVPFLLGIVGGYTTSCTSATLLFERGKIGRRECESIIALSSMPSLAFLCSLVGSSFFKSSTVGWIIWGITIASSLLCGIFNRAFSSSKKIPIDTFQPQAANKKSFPSIIIHAIIHSAGAMLTVCATVVFFSVLIDVSKFAIAELGIPNLPAEVLLGTLEITHAAGFAASVENRAFALMLAAFYIGWSGLSVHFQIIALCEGHGLSFKRYFILKATCAVISAALMAVAVWLFRP